MNRQEVRYGATAITFRCVLHKISRGLHGSLQILKAQRTLGKVLTSNRTRQYPVQTQHFCTSSSHTISSTRTPLGNLVRLPINLNMPITLPPEASRSFVPPSPAH